MMHHRSVQLRAFAAVPPRAPSGRPPPLPPRLPALVGAGSRARSSALLRWCPFEHCQGGPSPSPSLASTCGGQLRGLQLHAFAVAPSQAPLGMPPSPFLSLAGTCGSWLGSGACSSAPSRRCHLESCQGGPRCPSPACQVWAALEPQTGRGSSYMALSGSVVYLSWAFYISFPTSQHMSPTWGA